MLCGSMHIDEWVSGNTKFTTPRAIYSLTLRTAYTKTMTICSTISNTVNAATLVKYTVFTTTPMTVHATALVKVYSSHYNTDDHRHYNIDCNTTTALMATGTSLY